MYAYLDWDYEEGFRSMEFEADTVEDIGSKFYDNMFNFDATVVYSNKNFIKETLVLGHIFSTKYDAVGPVTLTISKVKLNRSNLIETF